MQWLIRLRSRLSNLKKYSNELEKNKKSLLKEDPEAFKALLKFLLIIEENLHSAEKDKYVELIKDFLVEKINAEDFSISFMAMYEGINQKLRQMKKDFKYFLLSVLEY